MSALARSIAHGVALTLLLTVGCSQQMPSGDDVSTDEPTAPNVDPGRIARHAAGARAASIRGDSSSAKEHMDAMTHEFMRGARIPDARRPIHPERARAAVAKLEGVRSVVWMDRSNLIVMVDGQSWRSQRMINRVCRSLEPLGDTLAVVVNLQDVTAETVADARTLSRNCRLPTGQRALLQRNRQIDVVSEEDQAAFDAQQ